MKKHLMDLKVLSNEHLGGLYSLLTLTPANGEDLPEMLPGQFIEIAVPESVSTLLRRPISINSVDYTTNQLSILVRNAGNATKCLIECKSGATYSVMLPLGNGFTLPDATAPDKRLLLIGGGVGVAPLLYTGKVLSEKGFKPSFLLGARSKADLLELDKFEKYGDVYVSTEDGSYGEKGLVTKHSALASTWDTIYCCGPAPMMKAVAAIAKEKNINCEVSLENMMACGVGACLCCVEKTVKGNVCVCTEGPVFNITELTW